MTLRITEVGPQPVTEQYDVGIPTDVELVARLSVLDQYRAIDPAGDADGLSKPDEGGGRSVILGRLCHGNRWRSGPARAAGEHRNRSFSVEESCRPRQFDFIHGMSNGGDPYSCKPPRREE